MAGYSFTEIEPEGEQESYNKNHYSVGYGLGVVYRARDFISIGAVARSDFFISIREDVSKTGAYSWMPLGLHFLVNYHP